MCVAMCATLQLVRLSKTDSQFNSQASNFIALYMENVAVTQTCFLTIASKAGFLPQIYILEIF